MSIFSKKKRRNNDASDASQGSSPGEQSSGLIGVFASAKARSELDSAALESAYFLTEAHDESRRDALERFLDEGADLILVLGSDAVVAEILTLHRRHFGAHRTPLNLAVMAVGAVHTVADALGAGAPSPKALKQLSRAHRAGGLKRRRLPMLKITSSALPASQYGFACGAGLFYDIFEGFHRGAGERSSSVIAAGSVLSGMAKRLVMSGSAAPKLVQARISVDGKPHAESFGFWLAGSLESSWFGLHLASEHPSFRSGDTPRELLSQVTQSRLKPDFLRALGGTASKPNAGFRRIHIDGSAGYVLDGELYDPDKPYILQIEPAAPAVFYSL